MSVSVTVKAVDKLDLKHRRSGITPASKITNGIFEWFCEAKLIMANLHIVYRTGKS